MPFCAGIDVLFFDERWHQGLFRYTSISFAGQRLDNNWSECFQTSYNLRIGPMGEPTREQWRRLHVRDSCEREVREYCAYKWDIFWKHRHCWRNMKEVGPFDWLSKDLPGLPSAEGLNFDDDARDVCPEPSRKRRLEDKDDAELMWPHKMSSFVVHPPPTETASLFNVSTWGSSNPTWGSSWSSWTEYTEW